MELKLLRGHLESWVLEGYSDGSGSGYGSGDGSGYGFGSGYGSGESYGSGYGSSSSYGSGSGYSDGSSDDSSDGHGHGDGYGDGYGHGDGYGDGHGHGHGYGYGHGDGDGYGYGDGYGDGDGSGSGYSYGYGDGYWSNVAISMIAGNELGIVAFWKSDKRGLSSNGGSLESPAYEGKQEKISGPLSICSHGLHATVNPDNWNGERIWLVELIGEFQQQDDKFAALERRIICEVPHGEARRKGRD